MLLTEQGKIVRCSTLIDMGRKIRSDCERHLNHWDIINNFACTIRKNLLSGSSQNVLIHVAMNLQNNSVALPVILLHGALLHFRSRIIHCLWLITIYDINAMSPLQYSSRCSVIEWDIGQETKSTDTGLNCRYIWHPKKRSGYVTIRRESVVINEDPIMHILASVSSEKWAYPRWTRNHDHSWWRGDGANHHQKPELCCTKFPNVLARRINSFSWVILKNVVSIIRQKSGATVKKLLVMFPVHNNCCSK